MAGASRSATSPSSPRCRPARFAETARRLADAGVAVTVLPSTDLFLMGRGHEHNVPRGVAPAHKLLEHGVTCSLATNNVLNPFTPFGDCSLHPDGQPLRQYRAGGAQRRSLPPASTW